MMILLLKLLQVSNFNRKCDAFEIEIQVHQRWIFRYSLLVRSNRMNEGIQAVEKTQIIVIFDVDKRVSTRELRR